MGKNVAILVVWLGVTAVMTVLAHRSGALPTSLGAEIAGSAVLSALLVGWLAPK